MPGGHAFYRVGVVTTKKLATARRRAREAADATGTPVTIEHVRPRAFASTLTSVVETVHPQPEGENHDRPETPRQP